MTKKPGKTRLIAPHETEYECLMRLEKRNRKFIGLILIAWLAAVAWQVPRIMGWI